MLEKYRIFAALMIGFCPAIAFSAFQGGLEAKTTHHDNFNLAYGGAEPVSEKVQTMSVNLTYFKASSREFVWLLKGVYSYNEYERYHHLSGSSAVLLGGFFYRFNPENSLTFEVGKRERRYDDEDLSLYEDDAWLANLKLMHRLSATTLMAERFSYEENETSIEMNEYSLSSAQLWFEWSVASRTTFSIGYVKSWRNYLNSEAEYVFEEPYTWLSYSLTKNIYTRIGYSKTKAVDHNDNRAYNKTAYIALGMGF